MSRFRQGYSRTSFDRTLVQTPYLLTIAIGDFVTEETVSADGVLVCTPLRYTQLHKANPSYSTPTELLENEDQIV